MNILCALGFHREARTLVEIWTKNRRGKRLRRNYAICKRCGKRLRWVKSHERQ